MTPTPQLPKFEPPKIHPTVVVLQEAVHVSPLIRFARYSALGLGIIWGAYRLRKVSEWHSDVRESQYEKKLEKAVATAKEQKASEQENVRKLMQYIGIPHEEGVAQFGIEEVYRPQ